MVNKKLWLGILVIILIFGVTVIGCDPDDNNGGKTPEQMSTAERWFTWTDPSSTATITHSVSSNDECTIVVEGTPVTDWWKAQANYKYTAVKGNYYIYILEMWTQSGTRDIKIQWYGDNNDSIYQDTGSFSINNARRKYNVIPLNYFDLNSNLIEQTIPKSGIQNLQFQCGNQTGEFYVKILGITTLDGNWVKGIHTINISGNNYTIQEAGVNVVKGTLDCNSYLMEVNGQYPTIFAKNYGDGKQYKPMFDMEATHSWNNGSWFLYQENVWGAYELTDINTLIISGITGTNSGFNGTWTRR